MRESAFMRKTNTLPVLLKILFAFFAVGLAIAALALFAAPQSSSERASEFSANAARTGIDAPQSSLTSAGASDEARRFVGYRHKGVRRGETLPNGATDLGGGLLSDEDYGVSRFSMGGKFMLWLEKIIERDDDGVPNWEVLDALVFDKLKKNQKFLFSYSSPCTKNGAENLDLIVMVEENRKRKTYKILRAWIANVETERFEPVSIDSIVCGYDGE
jgi:hypothetical protein